MEITWLGQGGFLFQKNGINIIIDPYLSESCVKLNKNNYRRMPIDKTFLNIKPQVIILTHNHQDHTDPETLKHYLEDNEDVVVLASEDAFIEIKKIFGNINCIKFNRHTVWTQNNITFTAVKAEHSDINSIGVIIDDGDKKYYITGDTLYNTDIFDDIPENIFALFIAMNGKGNNMNQIDAERFAKKVWPQYVVPMHWGMHDELYPVNFDYKNVVIPKIYNKIELK